MTDEYRPERRRSGRRAADVALELRVHALEEEMQLLREVSERNAISTSKVLEIVTMAEGFFKVLGYLGFVVKWCTSMGAAIGGVYLAWKEWKGQ